MRLGAKARRGRAGGFIQTSAAIHDEDVVADDLLSDLHQSWMSSYALPQDGVAKGDPIKPIKW